VVSWYKRISKPSIRIENTEKRASVPEEGLWIRCRGCLEVVPKVDVEANAHTCPRCNFHYRIDVDQRLALFVDEGSLREQDTELKTQDFLGFRDTKSYAERVEDTRRATQASEAFVSYTAALEGVAVELGCFEFSFMGGSMGNVVGEKVTRVFERALESRRPAIVFSASGGARMQEGIISLMQLAKTSVARVRLREKGIPYISILTDPTTGGVAASFAMQGDVIIAEPGALIGFAGPRVIEQTINQKLPDGFQRSEFLLEHGMIDRIVPRSRLRAEVITILHHLGFRSQPSR
jgi:acetyl-CoA carboxylase carboxyl transferase subunit beta